MAKYKTNAFEIILRKTLIGGTIYDGDGNPIIVTDLNYDPSVRCMYITDGVKKYKVRVDDYFDFEFVENLSNDRVLPGTANKFKNK